MTTTIFGVEGFPPPTMIEEQCVYWKRPEGARGEYEYYEVYYLRLPLSPPITHYSEATAEIFARWADGTLHKEKEVACSYDAKAVARKALEILKAWGMV